MYDNSLCNSSRRTEFVEMYLEIVVKGIQFSFFLAELFDKKGLLEECIRRIMELNWTETLWTDISFYESKRFFEWLIVSAYLLFGLLAKVGLYIIYYKLVSKLRKALIISPKNS